MIEIDKSDFLYKHLLNLGVENIEPIYLEYAENGVACIKDFKYYLASKQFLPLSEGEEIEEEVIEEILPYYADIKNEKRLTKTSTNVLLKEYKETKDKSAFEKIVKSKLKDLVYIASLYKYRFKEVPLSDLVQTCSLGIMKAIEKYNVKSKISFDEYINFWVNQEMEESFLKEKH